MPPAEVIPFQTWFAVAEEKMEVEDEEEEEEEKLLDAYWSGQFILSLFLTPISRMMVWLRSWSKSLEDTSGILCTHRLSI